MTPNSTHADPAAARTPRRRVLVIGLDGADWALFEPLVQDGQLPNIARVRSEGAWGGMLSTHPPVSAPAWASFTTGVWPGKHGVVDFLTVLPGRRNPVPVNAQWVKAPRVWHRAGEHGRRSICVNIPRPTRPSR